MVGRDAGGFFVADNVPKIADEDYLKDIYRFAAAAHALQTRWALEYGSGTAMDLGLERHEAMAASAVVVFFDSDSNTQQTHRGLQADAHGLRVCMAIDLTAIVQRERTLLGVLEVARGLLPGIMQTAHGGAVRVAMGHVNISGHKVEDS